MNATLARLHSFDPAAIGLADFGRGENYVARQVDRWSKQYRASETRDDRRDGAADRMAAGASCRRPGRSRLVHGDYRLDNVILHADRAEGAGGARLGTVDARRSARRLHLSPDAMAHAAGGHRRRHRLAGRLRSCGARHSVARAPMSTMYRRAHRARSAAASRRPISPTISSASPRSCRASSAACATAPRPASTPPAKAQMVRPLAETAWRFAREAGANERRPRTLRLHLPPCGGGRRRSPKAKRAGGGCLPSMRRIASHPPP